MQASVSKNFLLTVLLVILAFNFMDRLALGLLLQDIKVDFGLSDTQLGLLTGIAFALFYSVMGIPISLLALSPRYLRCGWHLWRASGTVIRDMKASQADPNSDLHGRSICG